MDGFQKRVNASVQRKLSLALSLAILVVAILAGGLSFVSAFDEAHELQDDVLRQVAQLMSRQRLGPEAADAAPHDGDGDGESQVIVQRLGPSAAAAPGALPLPADLADGLHTLKLDDEAYRVLVQTSAAGERIAVAQASSFRDEIARDGALRAVLPLLVLVPVLLLIVAHLVRQLFRPIAALSQDIDQRAEQDLRPIEDHRLPTEVRPFVVAINRLLARVSQAMAAQRSFVADAAHELRSPLTALSLQAERLADADMSSAARERLAVLRQGIDRGRHLLNQLLSLAKAQSSAESATEHGDAVLLTPVSLQAIYRRVLEDLLPLAEAKQIDLGVEGEQDALVRASELDLTVMVKNLVDNAIRYTPAGGRVDLSVGHTNRRAWLRVQDTGSGIAPPDRERVFDAFYRITDGEQLGSGLGLSIVQAIARRMGAEIQLAYGDEVQRSGLCVTVLFAESAASATAP
jgi:two-component system OmpR family sensor kinase